MKSWKTPTAEQVKIALSPLRATERVYFFSRLNNPKWISELDKEGIFGNPPGKIEVKPNSFRFPAWHELEYLVRMTSINPLLVTSIISRIPETDNPRVYLTILEAIKQLSDPKLSTALLPKAIEFAKIEYNMLESELSEVLSHWAKLGKESSLCALTLISKFINFKPDPKDKEKRNARQTKSKDNWSFLEPKPGFDQYDYVQILNNGVLDIARVVPWDLAKTLVNAVSKLNSSKLYEETLINETIEDYSEVWCIRVDQATDDITDPAETLVRALTYTCEEVLKQLPSYAERLERILTQKRWKVFERIRMHIYSKYPNENTLPYIKKLILDFPDYGTSSYTYEFHKMVQSSINTIPNPFLSQQELSKIFNKILNGPKREHYQHLKDEEFEKGAVDFKLKQLSLFKPLLFGEALAYFNENAPTSFKEPTSDSYPPYRREEVKYGRNESPKETNELETLKDEELIDFLNTWDDNHRDQKEWWVNINFYGLANQFKEIIEKDPNRFIAWKNKWGNIKRPIYLSYALQSAQELINKKKITDLSPWLDLAKLILTHQENEEKENAVDTSIEAPSWASARRAVCDFIGSCISKDNRPNIKYKNDIFDIISQLCSSYDKSLDQGKKVLKNHNDPITEAINHTRSRAIEHLVSYGWWVRELNSDKNKPISEVFDLFKKRFQGTIKVTIPERAMIGMQFNNIYWLSPTHTREMLNQFFPIAEIEDWRVTFESYLSSNQPSSHIFELIGEHFRFALEKIKIFSVEEDKIHRTDTVSSIGKHLFIYYLWGRLSLKDDELLGHYYKKTSPKEWAQIFDYVGRIMRKEKEPTAPDIIRRVIDFFDWRLNKNNKEELKEFAFWLEADELTPKWRLESFLKTLQIANGEDIRISIQLDALHKLLPIEPDLVVECFEKLTNAKNKEYLYFEKEVCAAILEVGLKSSNKRTNELAQKAQEQLVRAGRFEFLKLS